MVGRSQARKAALAQPALFLSCSGHSAAKTSLVLLEESSDPEQDIYAEPRLLRAIGKVPDEMIDALAA